ncbi:MAG: hypothetical protein ACTHLE_19960 [Agriterribacter sp.]
MKLYIWILVMAGVTINACNETENKKMKPDNHLKDEAINTLRNVMKEQQEWVKVHAAEFLIWTGNAQGVKEAFLTEQELFRNKPQYRIGIWRVLTQLSSGNEATQYKEQIVQAFLDTAGKDRIHAIETMAKLKVSPLPQHPAETREALQSDIKSLAGYTHWAIAYTNADSMSAAKNYFLERLLDEKEDILLRRIAAYVLRNSENLEVKQWIALSEMVLKLPEDAEGKVSFLTAALLTVPAQVEYTESYKKIFTQLLSFSSKKEKGTRMEVAAALAAAGTTAHLSLLESWLRNEDPTGKAADDADVQASAAFAILGIVISGR